MKIKTFKIRLDDQLHPDEQALNTFLEAVNVKRTIAEFVPDRINYWTVLICYEDKRKKDHDSIMGVLSDKISFSAETPLSNEEGVIYNALQKWRNDMASKTSLPGYMICNRSELITISKVRPKNLEELGKIKGLGSRKLLKYGDDILALLNSV